MAKTLHIGFENAILIDKIVGIFTPDTLPIKNLISDAKERGFVVNLTKNKKTRSVILMESDYVILSAISPRTLIARLEKGRHCLDSYSEYCNEHNED